MTYLSVNQRVKDISINKQEVEATFFLSTMKVFAAGLILLLLVAYTLGDELPRFPGENAYPVQENAHPVQENGGHGALRCLIKFIRCVKHKPTLGFL